MMQKILIEYYSKMMVYFGLIINSFLSSVTGNSFLRENIENIFISCPLTDNVRRGVNTG